MTDTDRIARLERRVAALESQSLRSLVGKIVGQRPRPRAAAGSVLSFTAAQARQQARRAAAADPGAFLASEGWVPFARAGAPAESGAAAGSAVAPAVRFRMFSRAAAALVLLWRLGRGQ
jgi:hypothetical protein